MFKKILYFFLFLSLLGTLVLGVVGFWAYRYVTRDLPDFHNVEDYRPAAVTSVYANDGTLAAEFFEERRYPIKLNEIPLMVRNCFLAAEDASFYSHQGIDPVSIFRAALKNLRKGSASQGGSTITQQVVKNLLLTPEKKLIRKAKEAILSYRLEKRLTKDEILEIYLNQIFFGNNAYGIRAAALTYYHKEPRDLNLAEASMLAALPKAPSTYSPVSHYAKARRRQEYVLDQMLKVGLINRDEHAAALKEQINFYRSTATNIFHAPYYIGEVRRIFNERWKDLNIDLDGLKIYTALDIAADEFAERAVHRGLREVDKRRGWRGPIARGVKKQDFEKQYNQLKIEDLKAYEAYPALVTDVQTQRKIIKVSLGKSDSIVDLSTAGWARKRIDSNDTVSFGSPEQQMQVGDVIEVALQEKPENKAEKDKHKKIDELQLDQSPDLESAVVILDPFSGKVAATIGGYSYQRSYFNRVTQSYRQPGSSFKPIVYLAAIDGFGYTPTTIVQDAPRTFKVGDEYWTPGNYDKSFLGNIPLQVALERSRNLVSADIVSKIGIDAVISYAKKLGIQSKVGRNLSISLGSSEVTLLELARAYGVFAAKGVLFPSLFITKIEDRFGKVIYDSAQESINSAAQVINENSAFIMAHMMTGVVQRGTGVKVKELGRPAAGKTGTSNEQMDTWFIGYTPNWVCGVWVGFDVKKTIGDKETGGRVAAPIFVYSMKDFLDYKDAQAYQKLVAEAKSETERLGIEYVAPDKIEPLDFSVPDGVDPFWVDKDSGIASEPGAQGAILEYFLKGTEPSKGYSGGDTQSYLESPEL